MRFWTRLAPIVVPLLIVIAVTEVLYFFKDVVHARHLVFFYLLPTAFVAMLYGSVLSMIVAIDATFLAAFFLCEPSYTLHVSDPREVGELQDRLRAESVAQNRANPRPPPPSLWNVRKRKDRRT